MDLTYFSLAFGRNLDIVQTDAPDMELTEMGLLLTSTIVFGFSLNDKNLVYVRFDSLTLPAEHSAEMFILSFFSGVYCREDPGVGE